MNPTRKSVMAWQLINCCNGDMPTWAARLHAAGITTVFIKAANGMADYNAALLPAACTALRAVGIQVWGWQYIYGGNVYTGESIAALEVEAAARNLMRHQFAGWVIDPESEYKRTGAGAWADTFMHGLRSRFPALPIGLCSYRFPSYHPELPWSHFLPHCDFHMPQVYWVQATNPGEQLRRSYRELTALANLPVYPVGAAYYESGWQPTVAQINEFDRTAHELGLPGVSWWCWDDQGIESHPEYQAAISLHNWPPQPPPAPDWRWQMTTWARENGYTGIDPD